MENPDNETNHRGGGTSSWQFGAPDAHVQKYLCQARDLTHVLTDRGIPKRANPLWNWTTNVEAVLSSNRITSWFRRDDHVAFCGGAGGAPGDAVAPLTYHDLHEQVANFESYTMMTDDPNSSSVAAVVGLLLPLSLTAEWAVSIVTLLAQHNHPDKNASTTAITLAPMDPNTALPKLKAALRQLKCSALVTTAELYRMLQDNDDDGILASLNDVRLVQPSDQQVGAVTWKVVKSEPLEPRLQVSSSSSSSSSNPNLPALLLRTSGTTSTPKLVPIALSQLLYNATCLAASLELQPHDVACHAMPLFHIGGIACGLLAVLVSGSSTRLTPGPFEANTFLDALLTPIRNATEKSNAAVQPTWYTGVPSMHKALLLVAQGRHNLKQQHQLRFIRNGAAHLPHDTALELARAFGTNVIQSYSMSECMPICSTLSTPITAKDGDNTRLHEPELSYSGEEKKEGPGATSPPKDTVGVPIGCSVAIVGEMGQILPYGESGEVCIQGPGVMEGYIGIDKTASHVVVAAPNGGEEEEWFRTGDVGQLDRWGRLVLSGRLKEMIKRGGDQVWPNEIDGVIEKVDGVRLAVSFGVPNELWGEEVQAAVVLDDSIGKCHTETLSKAITEFVEQQLGQAAKPSQILYVASTDDIPKGSTGKYLRTKMADHFGVKSLDTRALQALQGISTATLPDHPDKSSTVQPSHALNGVRFLASYFVCQVHMGLYPSKAWTKIQSFSLSMPIFFFLAGFQVTCNTQTESTSWGSFVGSKIGSMHAGVVVSQLLALPASLVWQYGIWEGYSNFPSFLRTVAGQVFTGMFGYNEKNLDTSWFQTVLYQFIILFPFLNTWIGSLSNNLLLILGAAAWISTVVIPSLILNSEYTGFGFALSHLHYTIWTWMPALVAAVFAGHIFRRFGPAQSTLRTQKESVFQNPQSWGVITDVMSVAFLLLLIAVGLSDDCTWVNLETYQDMRGEEAEYDEEDIEMIDEETCVWACNVTWDEFENYIHANEESYAMKGRWTTEITEALWCYRYSSPIVMIWLYGLAFGHGFTARIMKTDLFQFLSSLSYPIYMIHVPIARYYWIATRGLEGEDFWELGSDYPFPVAPQEVLTILIISGVLAYSLDHHVFPHVMPYTVRASMFVCETISAACGFGASTSSMTMGNSVSEQVRHLVKGVSGGQVSHSSRLDSLGLDSLGASALLGILRARMSSAERLSIQDLATLETVGDLVDLLSAEPDKKVQ